MKKYFVFVLCLVSLILFGQNTRFVYEVSMRTDSTAAPITENAYLDVTGKNSVFYGEKRVQRDSIIQRNFQTRNFDRSQMEQYRSQINYQIDKDYADQKIVYKNRIGRDLYTYTEDRPLNWKILNETMTIGEYKVQKAQTNFGGRLWTAWFSADVPIMDGPYKFSGLPGLIIKVEDSKGDYSFDLKQTKNIGEIATLSDSRRGIIINLKRSEYDKQQQKFRNDPASFLNSGGPLGNRIVMGRDGNSVNPNDPAVRKAMEEQMREHMKKDNNPIEK